MRHGLAPCETVPPLSGFRVGITADRRAEEQAELLRRRGADVMVAPVLATRAFGDDRRLRDATTDLLAHPPDIVVATTGIGVRSWFAAAESWGLDGALRDALAGATIVSRGPKASAAWIGVGLASDDDEPSEQLAGLVDRLVAAGVKRRRIALQLYGEDVPWAIERLTAAGAEVVAVPVYRWTAPDDLDPARRLVDAVVTGQLDAVTFTSAAAVRSLGLLADRAGSGAELRQALSSSVVAACVGPVTAGAAAAVGFDRRCTPDRGRLGLLVRALSRELHARHRHLRAGDREFVLHGASVWTLEGSITVSDVERMLLAVLAERAGVVVSRATLRRRVWGDNCGDAAVDKGLSRLRRSLAPVGLGVDVVTRRGWSLVATEVPCPHVGHVGDDYGASPALDAPGFVATSSK
jgi:uroporphyrinogen-III synthase